MTFKTYDWRFYVNLILLFGAMIAAAWLLVSRQYLYLSIVVVIGLNLLVNILQHLKRVQQELDQFVEAVRFRDFSRHYAVKSAPVALQTLRRGFNELNTTYKTISRERETQYQYLQKVLELVGTGILSYEQDTGLVSWINDAFKNILNIPYLKNIHSLESRDPNLYHEINKLRPGDNKVLTIHPQLQTIKILITASLLRSDNKLYKLVAFQNISDAMDESESNAWQKLLNVMTHEIMNSVAPISSLADTLKNRLQKPEVMKGLITLELEDLELGVDTIKRRSEGLLKFTESYRNINKITQLDLTKVPVYELFENLNTLMLPTLEKKNIELDIILRDLSLTIEIDLNLLEQVLINLLVNAIEAVKDQPEPLITLSAEIQGSKTLLKVSDNGTGMPPEIQEKIFIPFFSTRKTGSGIGLSLCKQIMLLHKGNIQVHSAPERGTVFTLTFS
ncbi:HAMP domain-containing histidine kinase [Mucilaginibacter robiniae]|uniref:histidine kinase n=1 Tax=Mucilaginibacter robiniae TaxID=2728022 RepID=A0A7L5E4F3_9SPHI|nr:HAMP domain-containing sensor histidine kinase [Mucilaginibacter robiniae]QJD98192.1 HAMP domain-containing histidine kinase [Mucilaginibacter robiniae]